MSHKSASSTAVRTIGIDLGKNSFHLVGLDQRGAIVLQLKCSRAQLERRLVNIPSCLIGMEAWSTEPADSRGGLRWTTCSSSSPAGSDHRDMTQAVPAHRCDRIEEMVVRGNGNDRRSHHVLDRLIGRRAPGDTPHHVLLGENAGRPAVGIGDDRHAAAGLRHAVHGLADGSWCVRPPPASVPCDRGQRSEIASSANTTDRLLAGSPERLTWRTSLLASLHGSRPHRSAAEGWPPSAL
jgi:hypothetical protein